MSSVPKVTTNEGALMSRAVRAGRDLLAGRSRSNFLSYRSRSRGDGRKVDADKLTLACTVLHF